MRRIFFSILDKVCKNRYRNHGQNTADHDGQTAHGAFDLTQLHGFCSSQRMSTGTNGKTFGNRILDLTQAADRICQNIT